MHRGHTVIQLFTVTLIVILATSPAMSFVEDEPTIYLQPHQEIPTMVVWKYGRARRTMKRGALTSLAVDIAFNVVYLCTRRH